MLEKYIKAIEKQCETFFEFDDLLHNQVKLIQEGKFELDNLKKKEKEKSQTSLRKSQSETETINFSYLNLQNCIDDHIYQLSHEIADTDEYLSSPTQEHIVLLENQLIDLILKLQEDKKVNE